MTSAEKKETTSTLLATDLEMPGVGGVITMKEFVRDNFEARLEYNNDSITISVKDKSNQQVFSSIFSQKAIADMNFNQPICNVVSMIILANDENNSDNNGNNSNNSNKEQSALSLTFGYFNKDTPLSRNGFSQSTC